MFMIHSPQGEEPDWAEITFETLEVEQHSAVLHAWLNRPYSRNAFTAKVHKEFEEEPVNPIEDDDITTASRSFASQYLSNIDFVLTAENTRFSLEEARTSGA